MAQEPHEYVIATHRVDHPDGGPALYGVGDKIPYAHAVELGLTGDDVVAAHQAILDARAKQPAEDRAKKPSEDRAKPKRRTRKKATE